MWFSTASLASDGLGRSVPYVIIPCDSFGWLLYFAHVSSAPIVYTGAPILYTGAPIFYTEAPILYTSATLNLCNLRLWVPNTPVPTPKSRDTVTSQNGMSGSVPVKSTP